MFTEQFTENGKTRPDYYARTLPLKQRMIKAAAVLLTTATLLSAVALAANAAPRGGVSRW
ncbi:hypothetical protein SAMN04487917_102360 [Arthrobacter sp. yr096]|nr:hypothetical protein SAMN04487912_101233 [Arthrobacter sp. cf158]SEI76993.1 hypothetical protein SAMN04487917_102360 [Arthrobacter sp. yr096]